jgi:UDP-N-acetylmuramoylalanine--D-glutamate ligase
MKRPLTLFGYGKTTQAVASQYGQCHFYDDKVSKPFKDANGNRVLPSNQFDAARSFLEIPSPGIPPTNPLIQHAKHLMSDYDFYADVMPFSIWVSGTNGKTTTTQMIEHMLLHRGAVSGGNIGTPVALLDKHAPIWVLETSSFTLHYTNRAKPNIYVLLPITPDHLSWHGSMKEYEEAKLKPLQFLKEAEAVILPQKYADVPTAGFKILYQNEEDLAEYFDIDLQKIRFKGVFLLDAVIAMGIEKILYNQLNYEQINSFVMDAHRQEELYDASDRLWINDSKATNVDATLGALRAFKDKKIHLILGGDDKGVDLHPLFKALQPLDITLYLIGSNSSRLETLCKTYSLNHFTCNFLDNAIDHISTYHTKNSVALLSPAAASLDQFPSYVARGEEFKKKVLSLS